MSLQVLTENAIHHCKDNRENYRRLLAYSEMSNWSFRSFTQLQCQKNENWGS